MDLGISVWMERKMWIGKFMMEEGFEDYKYWRLCNTKSVEGRMK